MDNGLADGLRRLIPAGSGLLALLGIAVVAAVLVLLPLSVPAGSGAVLAVLLGVNIGPNLTYAGSLATLLWRRVVHDHDHEVNLKEFTRLGLLTVPACLVLSVVALWLVL
ncbi:hypothetical protein L3Q67_42125 [Saccharothrix sp. AJ9571]|nr:hypothetical protein L3Q67_42125 [Saccharothrix sp. AJ9571]